MPKEIEANDRPDMGAPSDEPLETVDPCLADVTHDEYCEAQAAFPGFVDDDDSPTDDDVAEGDTYALPI